MYCWLFLVIGLFAVPQTAHASHIPGANITYTCNPANPLEYTFTLTLFRRCPGTHPTSMSSGLFTLTNDCGLANPTIPTFNQVGTAVETNQLCASVTSNCVGGIYPGVWKYTYEATVVLPADCDAWTMRYELCCRDVSDNLSGGSSNRMVTSTTLNTLTAPCNNSPQITSDPIPYGCAGEPYSYCLSISDLEGDLALYSLVSPQTTGGTPIAHNAGYSPTQPLNNFNFDPATGCLTFNHPTPGQFVVAIKITSVDIAGDTISEIIHDFKIIVQNCTNSPPVNVNNGVSNVSGSGTQTGPNTIASCYGDNVCFDVVFADTTNPGDSLTIVTDALTLLPGATFTQTGVNPVTGTLCWVSQPGYTGNVVTFIVQDNGCPVRGNSGFSVNFDITTGVYAGPDITICGSQTAQLQAYGAGSYTWTPATNLSCTNCSNPIATPTTTTSYIVTGNLTGVCNNIDTVTVNVVPDFPITLNPTAATICANEIVQLSATGPGATSNYTYEWEPAATLTSDIIHNPIANPLTSTTYDVSITAANGCVMSAQVPVTVSGVGPTVVIEPADTTLCPGESVILNSSAYVYPAVCGPSAGCTGNSSTLDVGSGTFSTTTYSPFFGSTSTTTNYTAKIQFIYTAAELNALGYNGGTINSLALFFTSSNNYQYDDVEIKMGCTNQMEYTGSSFIDGSTLTTVYNANDVNPANNNWETFNISGWDWDGTSNLVIQICTREDNANNSGSESIQYENTFPEYKFMYDRTTSTTAPSCPELIGSRASGRPNIRFGFCQQTVGTPTYAWTPAATLSSATAADPIASPTATTTYFLNVLDGNTGCTGSGSAIVNVKDLYVTTTPASVARCNTDPATQLNAQVYYDGNAIGVGSTLPYTEATTTTLPSCSNVTGGTVSFTFNNTVPDAVGNVTLTICVAGDFGSTSENYELFGEGGVSLGTFSKTGSTVPTYGDCGTTPFCHDVTITQAQWNSWNLDGQVILTADAATNVNNFCSHAGNTGTSFCVTTGEVNYMAVLGASYVWSPGTSLSSTTIPNPTTNTPSNTTYTVAGEYAGCTVTNTVDVTINTASTAPILSPVVGTQCPNTTMTLSAAGGVAGLGSTIEWYTGPNGTGTWLGSGSTYSFIPTNGQDIFIRREGACGNTSDDSETITLKDYVYGANATNATTYCTDNNGWHHFYDNDDIILSIRGDLSGAPAGFPIATVWDNNAYYQQGQGPFTTASCPNGLTPGEERFEMERSWNVDFGGGTFNGTYDTRFYYLPAEKTAVENAAAAWMAANPTCGYTYKYATPNGSYWFKNTGSNYTAPDYDGLHLTATGGTAPNGTNYTEMTGITSFSGGGLGVILVPNTLLKAEWLYFEGETVDNSKNLLRWATASEQNTTHFNIQRSQDGISFSTIGATPAQGNSTTTHHYTYDDNHPFEGGNYYRLELVNGDGSVSYSNTILLVINPDNAVYSFYPNPTQDVVFYNFESTKAQELEVEIMDVLGRVLESNTAALTIGSNNIEISLEKYPVGTYLVRVKHNNSGAIHISKVVKKGN